jgi:hypothetical protein
MANMAKINGVSVAGRSISAASLNTRKWRQHVDGTGSAKIAYGDINISSKTAYGQ